MEKKKEKYGFGLCQERCFTDTFDTIEELIAFATDAYNNPDGIYWDDDMDDYVPLIWIGNAETITPSDFAPSLEEIANTIEDSFYCTHNIDDNEMVRVCDKEKANEEWKKFVNKYFDMPCQVTCNWIGIYDLNLGVWVELFKN
jgi:hypothetical protein